MHCYTSNLLANDSDPDGDPLTIVSITIEQTSDPIAVDDFVTVNENESTIIDLLANDSDPDASGLSITWTSTPQNGTVTTDGFTITYTPNAGFVGADSFTYDITSVPMERVLCIWWR